MNAEIAKAARLTELHKAIADKVAERTKVIARDLTFEDLRQVAKLNKELGALRTERDDIEAAS